MGFKRKYHLDVDFEIPVKLRWWLAPLFTAFWLVLFASIVLTQMNSLPKAQEIRDERFKPNTFIADRAEQILIELTKLGPRVVGSEANENGTVQFLLNEIKKIRDQANDYFEIEIDVQEVSGAYMHWLMINMYQAVQNVVVKLSAKNSTNENYLLINSHFDSVPTSPGAGDDGSMVVIMLEVMRVIASSTGPLKHPIIFLFNGAEENPLQASHGFITQHKWAKNCKALINLDSAGNGGREVLFQSGPNHPWLMNYYRDVPHPLATTLAEEIFQAGLIPSDTDFRIFRDYGGVPGLDMAFTSNGYVYHTEFDRVGILPRGSLQNAGDNVLFLAKSIANAPEMTDTTKYQDGHVIFFDFLGWFMVFYTETTGIIINVVVCVAALIAIIISLYFMSARSGLRWSSISRRFALITLVQFFAIVFGGGLALVIALFMDGVGRSLSWFSENWLLLGLYFCPILFGMGILPAIYLQRTKEDLLSLGFRIQLFMHAHCLILIVFTIILTACGIRSAFMFMIAIFFDVIALIINLITKWHRKAYWFAIAVIICQILPFLYYTSQAYLGFYTFIPMTGRSGSGANPEMTVAGLAVLMTFLFAGFILPLFMFFQKTRTIMFCFLGVAIVFIIVAVTPAGFPYTAKTATQRLAMIHSHRVIHNPDNSTRIDESGIYVYPQDRRINEVDEYIDVVGEKRKVSDYCSEELFCGMPIYNHRWQKDKERSYWIPTENKPEIPSEYPQFELKSKNELDVPTKVHFEFSLKGPDHMAIFIGIKHDTKIINWSFNDTLLKNNVDPPYFIYFSYGNDSSALEFWIDIEKSSENIEEKSLEIGISGHWIHQNDKRSTTFREYVNKLPDYASVMAWVATYESWYF